MDRIKLQDPRFRIDDTLTLVRGLSLKTLTNWCEHSLVKTKIIGRKRFFSGTGIVGLQAMIDLGALGILPSDARPLAMQIVHHAIYLHEVCLTKISNGFLEWPLSAQAALHHTGYVFQYGGKNRIVICNPGDSLEAARAMLPDFYIVAQVDSLCLTVFNRIYAHLAGVALPDNTGIDSDLADIVKNISNAGAKK